MDELRASEAGSNYDLLIAKLDKFIRKFYINQALRGVLITVAICVVAFLGYAILESQAYLPRGGRKLMFFSYLLLLAASFGLLVIRPMLKYFSLGKRITHDTAATILGEHFENVEDRLLNVLQLQRAEGAGANALVMASIDQKADQIKVVPFRQAIDLTQNRKYLRYAAPPVLALMFLLFAAPSLITESTYRIINNDEDFERPAPFTFQFPDEEMEVVQFEDYRLTVDVEGEKLPSEAFITIDNYDYRLTKEDANTFSYLFPNVRKATAFKIYSGRQQSSLKTLTVLPKPQMVDFDVSLRYPSYTGRKNEIISNSGDFAAPVGTVVNWTFRTRSTDEVSVTFGDEEPVEVEKQGSATYDYKKSIYADAAYTVGLTNDVVDVSERMDFYIRAIQDEYPQIEVDMIQDSLEADIYYFIGSASDDYGLTKLNFVYERVDELGQLLSKGSEIITFDIATQSSFDHILDIMDYELGPGEKLNYYFEVYDNDQVNGSKSAKTSVMSHRRKSVEELKEEEQKNEEEIKDKLKESIEESKKIKEDLKKLRKNLLQKEEPDWRDKKELEEILERQQKLQKQLQEAQDANAENLQNQEQMQSLTPELMEKQERLQQLFEETVNDEMQELMEQIQELMQELGKEESLEMMEEFELQEEELQSEMERLEELYKQLEVEKEINESLDKLHELADELEKLSEETKDEKANQESLQEKQEDINDEFEKLEEKVDDLFEKNESLEFPKDMPSDTPELMDEISDELQEGQEQLEQQQNQDASDSQKGASQKMKKMAAAMQSQMQSGQQEQASEDIDMIRQLLENLVTLSFDQENLLNTVNRTVVNTPRYVSAVQQQLKIKDDFRIVQDSLEALSKRQAAIETFVLEKVSDVKSNLATSMTYLEDRKKPEANQSQRSTMTNLNDLALMLSESMENMQQQMAGMMSGSQNCQKPGNSPGGKKGQKKGNRGDEPSDRISEGQEKMSEKLQQMLQNMREGKGNSSKDFAEAAARQAALRKALHDLSREQQEQGQGLSGELQKIIDEMDKQEIDLVNKRLDNEMLTRQQDIMTRLLEAENAQRQREFDNKRKSESGKDVRRELPPSLQEYINERKAVLEQYKYVSPDLRPHYKKLVDQYYKKLKRA
ncbi:MAG: DUF4175 family protein [Bacteroidota bacterium]